MRVPHIAGGGDDDIRLAGAGCEVGAPEVAAADNAQVNAAVRAGAGLRGWLSSGSKVRRGETDGGDGGGLFQEGSASQGDALLLAAHLAQLAAAGTVAAGSGHFPCSPIRSDRKKAVLGSE